MPTHHLRKLDNAAFYAFNLIVLFVAAVLYAIAWLVFSAFGFLSLGPAAYYKLQAAIVVAVMGLFGLFVAAGVLHMRDDAAQKTAGRRKLMKDGLPVTDESIESMANLERLENATIVASSIISMSLLFVWATWLWQQGATKPLFLTGRHGIADISLWALDLSCRGMLFDVMEHYQLSFTSIRLNLDHKTFTLFSFIYRMYCSVAVLTSAVTALMHVRSRRVVIGPAPSSSAPNETPRPGQPGR